MQSHSYPLPIRFMCQSTSFRSNYDRSSILHLAFRYQSKLHLNIICPSGYGRCKPPFPKTALRQALAPPFLHTGLLSLHHVYSPPSPRLTMKYNNAVLNYSFPPLAHPQYTVPSPARRACSRILRRSLRFVRSSRG